MKTTFLKATCATTGVLGAISLIVSWISLRAWMAATYNVREIAKQYKLCTPIIDDAKSGNPALNGKTFYKLPPISDPCYESARQKISELKTFWAFLGSPNSAELFLGMALVLISVLIAVYLSKKN